MPVSPPEPVAPAPRRYTFDGDAEVESRVAKDQALIADAVTALIPAERFVALVLMGGYGRGEGGYVVTEHGPAPYNDYDYFIIVRGVAGAQRATLLQRLEGLSLALAERVGVDVDFALLPVGRLKRAEFSLMNAEMRWGHRVVAGDAEVLSVMPDMPFHALPPAEFTRLMLNRGTLLLMNQRQLLERRTSSAGLGAGGGLDRHEREIFFKYLMKAIRACGDTRLAAIGRYHPSYAEKLDRLEATRADEWPDEPTRPNPMPRHDEFLPLYQLAHRHKFHPAYREFDDAAPADWLVKVVRIWADTLRAFEIRRLGHAVAGWQDYCRADLPKGQGGNLVRNLGVTARDFGAPELLRQPRRALRYPRERLIAALPLLLTQPDSLLDACAARALTLPANTHWKRAVERFLALWAKYA
jgi:hypothetical protein